MLQDDLDVSELNTQLPLLHEIIKKASPDVRSVTSIHTTCDVMDSNEVFKEILPAVHKLLRRFDYPNNVCHSRKSFFSTQASAYIFKIIDD